MPRYADRLQVLQDESEGSNAEIMEVDKLIQVAERFGLARQFDRIKINTMCGGVPLWTNV